MLSSQLALKPVSTAPLSCKICDSSAELYGVVDFHKSCNPALRTPVSGVPIYYRRCADCKFLFTDAFDDWSTEQFKTYLYNDEYKLVDPDYQITRPRANRPLCAPTYCKKSTGTAGNPTLPGLCKKLKSV